jgi:hypothetical protein
MTPDQLIIAKWGGGLLAGLIVGSIVLHSVRGATFEERDAHAKMLGEEYVKLYPAEGMAIEEATATWTRLKEHQQAALKDAEASMVPILPRGYMETDLSSGAAQVHADLQYLKQKAQRTQVKLPGTLPFEEGLSPDANQRLLQLAQLYLYRNVLDTCMEAGIMKINSVKVETGPTDPQQKYALLLCAIDLDMPWDRTSQLLADFNQTQNRKGYGVRSASIEHDRSGNQRVSLTISLMTANNPAWGLRPDSAATQLPTTPGAPASNSNTGGSRFGRFGDK